MSATLLATGLILLLTLPQPGPWRFAVWGVPAALVLAGTVALEPVLGSRVPEWLLHVGAASFSIYLLHPFLVPLVSRVLMAKVPAGLALPVMVSFSVLFSVAGGLVLHRLVDTRLQIRLAAWPSRRGDAVPAGQLDAA